MTKIEEIIRKHVEACANEVFETVVLPKLDGIISVSKTTVDDVVWAAVRASIVDVIKKNFDKISPGIQP